jgi:hypothetical protein
MRFLILSFFILLVASQSGDQYEAFVAQMIVTAPQWGSGYYNGTFSYDWSQNKMQIDIPAANGYRELYVFNTDCGYNTGAIEGQFTYQYLYKTSNSCPCETDSLEFGMPAFWISSLTSTTVSTTLPYWIRPVSGDTTLDRPDPCTKYFANIDLYIAINGVNTPYYLANQFWVDSNNVPAGCTINDAQQRTFTFTSVTPVAPGSLSLLPPATGCKCGKLLDLVISLDRSGSISVPQWVEEYAFTTNLTNSFEYGPNQANVGICNWNAAQWTSLPLTSGNSLANVQAAVNSMTCCGTPPATSGSCCCCGTPIGGGLWEAGTMMLTSTRTKATKVIILLTDGCQNHIWQPLSNPQAIDCGCPSEKLCATDTNCTSDITKWYNWCIQNIPGVKIIAIGVGTSATICTEQLLLTAGGDPTAVYNPQSWQDLQNLVLTISATACTTDTVLCPGCCGICTCGVCYPPVNCFNQDACNLGAIPQGSSCCGLVPVACTPPPCNTANCDPKKGCVYTPMTCKPPSDSCSEWYCDNTTIICLQRPVTPLPIQCQNVTVPQCNVDSDCTIHTKCITAACVGGKCINTPVICANSTQCSFTECNPGTGCSTTNKTCDDQDACTADSCDPLIGCIFKNITCPDPTDPCLYSLCDKISGCIVAQAPCTNLTAGNCTVTACNETCYLKYTCYTPGPTGNEDNTPPTTVIITATLTGAAIAGIVCAGVLLAVGVGGGAVVAVGAGAGAGGMTAVYSNPVYSGTATAGNNPLNQQG